MKKDRFFIYYSGSGKVTSPKSVNGINYDGYLHNSDKKRMSFLFSNESEKGNFINDFQKGNPKLKIARTHVQKMSSSSQPSQPSQPSRTSSETSRKSDVKQNESPEARKEESDGNGNILLILALGAGAFFLFGKGKKRRK